MGGFFIAVQKKAHEVQRSLYIAWYRVLTIPNGRLFELSASNAKRYICGKEVFMPGYDETWFADQKRILDEQEELIRAEAQELVDAFWGQIKARKKMNMSEGRIGVRLINRPGGKIQIVWYEKNWVGAEGGRKLFSKAIPKGSRNKYHASKFARFQEWERELALAFENDFAELRAASECVSEQRKRAAELARRLRALGYLEGTEAFVEQSERGKGRQTKMGEEVSPC